MEDKWFATILLLLFGLIVNSVHKLKFPSGDFKRLFNRFSVVVSISCFFLAIYGIMQRIAIFPSNYHLGISGGFDNPAGYTASLCAGFPMILYLLRLYRSKWVIGSITFAGLLIIISVILSGSRTGILSLTVVLLIWVLLKVKVTKRLLILFSVGIVLLLSVLYFCKRDSANGRLLIWQCSWGMIKEKPLLGYGMNGFQVNYMDYQANYFEKYPDSFYVILADNTNHPFNEYLLLLINYGFVGFLLFIASLFFLWRSYRCNPCFESKVSSICLIGIAVFSCFSYPLSYPFVWVMMIFSAYVIISSANYSIKIPLPIRKAIYIATICLSLLLIIIVYKQMLYHITWEKTVRTSIIRQTDQTFIQYKKLQPKLRKNHLFLYNYAAELNSSGYYSQSQQIAEECNKFFTDYDLQLLMGYNCVKMEQYSKAEEYFEQAANMCPVRFIPLYELMKIYQLKEEKSKVKDIAIKILNKPVKIQSGKIKRIKEEAQEYLRLY